MFRMFVEALQGFPTVPALIAMILFVAVFVGIVFWAYRRSGRPHYDYMARLPLDGRDSE